jgi:hypothetical protein
MLSSTAVPLYALQALRCISDRSWAFLLPLHLAQTHPGSLFEVSTISAFATLGAVLLTPHLALYLRRRSGLARFYVLLAIENASVLAAGLMLVGKKAGEPLGSELYVAGVLLALDQSCSGVLENLVVKEWTTVVVAARGDDNNINNNDDDDNSDPEAASLALVTRDDETHAKRSEALSGINSLMSQIDLAVGVLVPFGVSLALERGTSDGTVGLLLLWHVVSALAIAALAAALCRRLPSCATSPDAPLVSGVTGGRSASSGVAESLEHAWAEFSALPRVARRNVVAYVLLFVSVVSPSGLTVAWLRANGVSVRETAALRSAVQMSGFAGTLAAPRLIWAFGLEAAAPTTQGLQTVFVVVACAACLGGAVNTFMLALVCSRFGLWAYDLCERQLVQRGASGAGQQSAQMVFAAERCGSQLMDLMMSMLAMSLSSTDDYTLLVIVSTAAVTAAHAIIRT